MDSRAAALRRRSDQRDASFNRDHPLRISVHNEAQGMVQRISRRTFDAFNPERPSIAVNRFEEVEWLAERSKVVIGFVARDRISSDWTIGVQGRDEHGRFHEIESEEHIAYEEDARELLLTQMNRIVRSGTQVFPRAYPAGHRT
jgi:hypothetical protein